MNKYALIRCALLDARQSLRHYRATGETRVFSSPLPDQRNVDLYDRAYQHGLRSFA